MPSDAASSSFGSLSDLTATPSSYPIFMDAVEVPVHVPSIRVLLPYPVLPENGVRHGPPQPWADVTPRVAQRLMTELLTALASGSRLNAPVLTERFRPFVIKNAVWNTEFVPLIERIHAVWDTEEAFVSTHQLHQFYGLVVGAPATYLPYITTVGNQSASWFVNRPNTDEWTSVQNHIRTNDHWDFARSFLYQTPYNRPQRNVRLQTADRIDLENIINAGNVMGPRHYITRRIVRRWILKLIKQHNQNPSLTNDHLSFAFNSMDQPR